MSSSPFFPHIPNPITPFSYNLKTKRQIPFKCNSSLTSKTETKRENEITKRSSQIKAPTAPWMSEPLLVKPNEILHFKTSKTKKDYTFNKNEENHDMGLTGKVGGGRGKVAMKKIYKGIEMLKETHNSDDEDEKSPESIKFKFKPGDLWGHKNYRDDEERNEFDVRFPEIESEGRLRKMPWERDESKGVSRRVRKERVVTNAESRLDGMLLERLRDEAVNIKKWVKVKKVGVTQDVVEQVRLIWRDSELALIRFDLPLCRNMNRAWEIVEVRGLFAFAVLSTNALYGYRLRNF